MRDDRGSLYRLLTVDTNRLPTVSVSLPSIYNSVVVTGSVAVRKGRPHLLGWSSGDESDSEEPSHDGVHKGPVPQVVSEEVVTRGRLSTHVLCWCWVGICSVACVDWR